MYMRYTGTRLYPSTGPHRDTELSTGSDEHNLHLHDFAFMISLRWVLGICMIDIFTHIQELLVVTLENYSAKDFLGIILPDCPQCRISKQDRICLIL